MRICRCPSNGVRANGEHRGSVVGHDDRATIIRHGGRGERHVGRTAQARRGNHGHQRRASDGRRLVVSDDH